MTVNWSDVAAYSAIGLSLIALLVTYRFNERQKKFFENQEELNSRLLQQVDADLASTKKADISGNFVKEGKNRHYKIYNKGKAQARNLRIEVIENPELLIQSQIEMKFPLEVLEPQQGVTLIAISAYGSPDKLKIRFLWEDDFSKTNSKELVSML